MGSDQGKSQQPQQQQQQKQVQTKSASSPPQVEQEQPIVPTTPLQQVAETTWVQDVKGSYRDMKKQIKENVQQPLCETWNSIPFQQYNKQYLKPFCEFYQQLPNDMTEFKQESLLIMGNENKRLLLVGLLTIGSVMALRRCQPGPLRSIRNSVVGYFGYGLFLAPEIFNPFLVRTPPPQQLQKQ